MENEKNVKFFKCIEFMSQLPKIHLLVPLWHNNFSIPHWFCQILIEITVRLLLNPKLLKSLKNHEKEKPVNEIFTNLFDQKQSHLVCSTLETSSVWRPTIPTLRLAKCLFISLTLVGRVLGCWGTYGNIILIMTLPHPLPILHPSKPCARKITTTKDFSFSGFNFESTNKRHGLLRRT